MSEVKVLHEATIDGRPVRVVERESGALRAEVMSRAGEPYRGLVDPYIAAGWVSSLAARVKELEDSVGWKSWVLDEIAAVLSALDKKHPGDPEATPPMMYREWVLCVVGQREKRIAQLEAAVRWAVNEQTREAHYFGDEKSLQTEEWERAHPVVREVIEKGGE